MRMSKSQAAVITLLNIVIIALAAVIFVLPLFSRTEKVQGSTEPPEDTGEPVASPAVHNKYRDASAGAVPGISRETRLMGNGDESVVAVYFRSGVSYIFGNATVKGLDYDEYGGFLCIVNAAGRTAYFTHFGGNIGAVGVVADGYAVGAGSKLYTVDYDGQKALAAETDGDIVDILTVDSIKTAVVTQPSDTSFRLTEYSTVSGYTAGRSTVIRSGYSLKFFDCYAFENSYVIAARASSLPRYDAAVFFSFTAGGDATAHYYGGTGDSIARPYAVMPCSAGYFYLSALNGMAAVITVDGKFVSYHSINLGFTFTDARLFFSGGKYYACFDRTDGAVTYELESDLSRRRLYELDGLYADCIYNADGIVAAGTFCSTAADGGGVKESVKTARIISPQSGFTLDLDIKNAEFYGGTKTDGGMTVALSATGGDALSAPTAGRDIYVITVKAGDRA